MLFVIPVEVLEGQVNLLRVELGEVQLTKLLGGKRWIRCHEERAFPFRREAAKKDSELMSFGCVLWRQEEASILKSRFGLELAPAVVFIKDPGVQPITVYGKNLLFGSFEMISFTLRLQSITASKLECDPADFSAAGKDVETWYCIVVAGRPGFQLDQLCSTMRIVQDELVNFAITASLLNPSMRLAGRGSTKCKTWQEF
ncbi:hypothetical protein SELMODRAFT_431095 [Selaginella moellendorffii]|uniref:Uncharacterized protein n=1 Tax=Selaginella moellendorffii TaxID=88036 RepID=D8TBI1_SELML|nr:hypothetical protein SELMODRAFT_431095 [Selaginella moellendorffii]